MPVCLQLRGIPPLPHTRVWTSLTASVACMVMQPWPLVEMTPDRRTHSTHAFGVTACRASEDHVYENVHSELVRIGGEVPELLHCTQSPI